MGFSTLLGNVNVAEVDKACAHCGEPEAIVRLSYHCLRCDSDHIGVDVCGFCGMPAGCFTVGDGEVSLELARIARDVKAASEGRDPLADAALSAKHDEEYGRLYRLLSQGLEAGEISEAEFTARLDLLYSEQRQRRAFEGRQ